MKDKSKVLKTYGYMFYKKLQFVCLIAVYKKSKNHNFITFNHLIYAFRLILITFVLSSTGQWKHVYCSVETRPQASGNMYTGLWMTALRRFRNR